jgi:hypothetical protein
VRRLWHMIISAANHTLHTAESVKSDVSVLDR